MAGLLAGHRRVSVMPSALNVGLGAALNRACERARELGFLHVLLMDQDSVLAMDVMLELRSEIGSPAARGG